MRTRTVNGSRIAGVGVALLLACLMDPALHASGGDNDSPFNLPKAATGTPLAGGSGATTDPLPQTSSAPAAPVTVTVKGNGSFTTAATPVSSAGSVLRLSHASIALADRTESAPTAPTTKILVGTGESAIASGTSGTVEIRGDFRIEGIAGGTELVPAAIQTPPGAAPIHSALLLLGPTVDADALMTTVTSVVPLPADPATGSIALDEVVEKVNAARALEGMAAQIVLLGGSTMPTGEIVGVEPLALASFKVSVGKTPRVSVNTQP